ncbi:hypothetical protein [Roseibium sp.]|uniref:hypothetical protein n=1 Tax=Roseibium sp. TaxID=1936156 RepID=UPI003265ABAD
MSRLCNPADARILGMAALGHGVEDIAVSCGISQRYTRRVLVDAGAAGVASHARNLERAIRFAIAETEKREAKPSVRQADAARPSGMVGLPGVQADRLYQTNLTAAIFGDPLPGESAWERKTEAERQTFLSQGSAGTNRGQKT